jgi:sodium-dependent dicarboxylate transporter 2/3/5
MAVFLIITLIFIILIVQGKVPSLLLSLLLPCAYVMAGLCDLPAALSPWQNSVMYLVIFGMVFSELLGECGLLQRIALHLIRILGDNYHRLVFGVFAASLLITCITFCQAWIMMISMGAALCRSIGYKDGSKETTGIMLAVLCGVISATVYTYCPNYATFLAGAYEDALGRPFQWYYVAMYMLPYLFLCIAFLCLYLKITRISNASLSVVRLQMEKELAKIGPLSVKEKKAFAVLCGLILFLVTSTWHGWPILYGFVAAVAVLYLPFVGIGTKEALSKINFGTIFFMVACMSIGTVGSAVGFDRVISAEISGILENSRTEIAVCGIFGVGAVSNFLMTPLAILTCFLKPVMDAAGSIGISVTAALFTIYASIDFYIFPYESTWALVFYGTETISMKDFIKWNLLRSIMLFVAVPTVFLPWWAFIDHILL